MTQLTAEQIFEVARGAGFTPDQAVTFTAIALAESSGRTDALASKGEHSVGLWQINVASNVRKNTWGDLTDPAANARAAYEISRSGTSLRPWTVTHERNAGTSRDYRRYLEEAQAARDAVLSGTAVPAVPAVAPDPVAEPAVAAAPAPVTALDSDHDGVTDALEVELGRSPVQADSDEIGTAGAQAQAVLARSTAPPAPAEAGPVSVSDEDATGRFLKAARDQAGDRYVFGAETQTSDTDPDAFDCSELVQWAAAQAGVDVVDGASNQYLTLKAQGRLIPVDQAAKIPGALLFSFSTEPQPGGGRPSSAHVAISLGNGSTIEARGRAYGVGEFGVGRRFDYAAVIPEFASGLASAPPAPRVPSDDVVPSYDVIDGGASPWTMDQDLDGLVDGAETVTGTDPLRADSDADGLSDSAEVLRYGTKPGVGDTDGDGELDGNELPFGRDPLFPDADLPTRLALPASALPTGASPTGALLAGGQVDDDSTVELVQDLMA